MEVAAPRRRRRIRDLPLQHDALRAHAGIRLRHRGEQRRGVRMLGGVNSSSVVGQLDHPADVHHGHAVADVPDHAQIVRDEQIGQPKLRLQIQQQVQDLRLHRDVERRDRLVGDHQARTQGQRARDADALALAAAERVREAPHVLRPQPDAAQQVGHPLLALPPARACRGPAAARRPVSSSVMRGLSEANGSWKIICISRRSARSSPARQLAEIDHRAVRARACRISPAVGSIARRMQRAVVVLPQPLSPTRPRVSPSSMWKSRRPPRARGPPCAAGSPSGSGRASAARRPRRSGPVAGAVIRRGSSSPRGRRPPGAGSVRPGRSAPAHELRAARVEGAAARPVVRDAARRRRSASSRSRVRAPRCWGSSAAARACRDAAARGRSRRTGPCSTTRPRYITTTSVGHLRDHAQVVGDQHDRHAVFPLQLAHQVEDLRLGGHVERGGRLVGDQQARLAGRAPWRSSRAGAGRRRAGRRSASTRCSGVEMPTRRSSSIVCRARLAAGRPADAAGSPR